MHLYGGVKLSDSNEEAVGIFTLDTRDVEVYKAPHYENLSVYINGKLVTDTDMDYTMNGVARELPAFGKISYHYNSFPTNYCFNGGEGAISFSPQFTNSTLFSKETIDKIPFVGFLSGANYQASAPGESDCDGDLFFVTSRFVNFRILE